jgi:hypothetical protein
MSGNVTNLAGHAPKKLEVKVKKLNENGFARAFGGDGGTRMPGEGDARLSPCFAGS